MEKSPPNTVRSPWLQYHFKPASFIAVIRSPFAVVEGIRRREGYSVERAALHWAVANEILLDDLDRLDKALLVRYEDLCSDPLKVTNQITDFLHIGQYPSKLLYGSFPVHNSMRLPCPIKNFNQPSIEMLSSDDICRIEDIAGGVMDRLGYSCLNG